MLSTLQIPRTTKMIKNRNNVNSLLSLVSVLLLLIAWVDLAKTHEDFLQCVKSHASNNTISNVIYTPENSTYAPLLFSSIQNLRFSSPSAPKPIVIVTPTHASQIQSVILCSKLHGLQVRVRCGGHDYEGLSYVSTLPFVVIDMRNFRSIRVETNSSTAWVQGGALLGEVYYTIAQKSQNLAFPAGLCPTVGVGGHFSGGGVGTLTRKYGLAADNVIDARIVNVNGEILDRKSMGEDLFWAIRGGGAASFGVVLEWKIKLVDVPSTVTVFNLTRTLEQNATKLVYKWQHIVYKLDRNLFIRVLLTRLDSEDGSRTVQASFECLFLGRVDKLVKLVQESIPELGLRKEDCSEMRWIEAVLYFSDLPSRSTLEDLLTTNPNPRSYYKAKSDYVTKPLPEHALKGLWKRFYADEAREAQLIFHPFGGKMDEISENETPFPHRAGNLYEIQHLVYWDEDDNAEAERYINWIRRLYDYMTPYVSHFPRGQYYNYRDLDLGVNNIEGNTSYAQASVWGIKYFKNNFYRLVQVKTMVDPANFFRNEQSIPPQSD